jgi:ketosteroid isomerase-like protein
MMTRSKSPSPAFALPAIAMDDSEQVSTLDLAFQAAVKVNDVATIDYILHPDYALVSGLGKVCTRDDILDAARRKTVRYTIQDEEPGSQKVRLWGDTAVVTALLHIAGSRLGEKICRSLWFSDTYVRTPDGWKYAFAQVSTALPDSEELQRRYLASIAGRQGAA